jgi:hypothetical protein
MILPSVEYKQSKFMTGLGYNLAIQSNRASFLSVADKDIVVE